jgi:hypothetical protein
MGRNLPEAAADGVLQHVPCGSQQGRMGLGLASPGRCQGGLVDPATRRGAGTRGSAVTTTTAVTAARPAVAQRHSPTVGDGEEKGNGWGGSPNMGHGSGAEADRASTRGGRRFGTDGNYGEPWSSMRWLTAAAPHERQAPTSELGRWCRAAPGAAVGGFWNRRKRENRGGLRRRLGGRRERKRTEGGPVARPRRTRVARRLPEQGRWGSDVWAPAGSERERERRRAGVRGPARGKGKWARPEETMEFSISSNKFQTSLNCFDQKVDLPSSKNFK